MSRGQPALIGLGVLFGGIILAAILMSVDLVFLSIIVGGLTAFGATYGGSLTYDYGFNVETSGDHPVWHDSEVDVFPGQH